MMEKYEVPSQSVLLYRVGTLLNRPWKLYFE